MSRILKLGFFNIRRYCRDPSKTFQDKGRAEENRYFLKKQQEELKKLKDVIERLEKHQKGLENQLDKTTQILTEINENKKK